MLLVVVYCVWFVVRLLLFVLCCLLCIVCCVFVINVLFLSCVGLASCLLCVDRGCVLLFDVLVLGVVVCLWYGVVRCCLLVVVCGALFGVRCLLYVFWV